jgi:hypothetical protein
MTKMNMNWGNRDINRLRFFLLYEKINNNNNKLKLSKRLLGAVQIESNW